MTGLCLRPEGISLARIQRDPKRELPALSLCQFLPLAPGDDLTAALAELGQRLHLDNAAVISVVNEDDFSLLLVEAPEVDPAELKAAVRWKIKDMLEFHIDDAVIDVFDIPGQQARGRPKLMYVVAARIAQIQKHIDLIEQQAINLTVIDIPELSQRNIAALLPEDETGVAMLSLSRQTGLLTLTRQANLYLARELELGAEHLRIEAPQAEPETGGMALEPVGEGDANPELQRLFDSIVLEVQRSLDYYESHFALPPIAGIVVAPTEYEIPGLTTHLANSLGVPVRMLDINMLVDSEQPLSDQLQAHCLSAIGAALRVEEKAL